MEYPENLNVTITKFREEKQSILIGCESAITIKTIKN